MRKPASRTRAPTDAQQLGAVGVLVGVVRVWEVRADVAEGRGAEEGVGNGVQEHVGVGVAREAPLVRNLDAAEDQRAPLHEAMHVVAVANAHGKVEGRRAKKEKSPRDVR